MRPSFSWFYRYRACCIYTGICQPTRWKMRRVALSVMSWDRVYRSCWRFMGQPYSYWYLALYWLPWHLESSGTKPGWHWKIRPLICRTCFIKMYHRPSRPMTSLNNWPKKHLPLKIKCKQKLQLPAPLRWKQLIDQHHPAVPDLVK